MPTEPQSVSLESACLCTSCGYDLRGLSLVGNCPECGKQISISHGGDLLEWGDATWRRKLIAGSAILCAMAFLRALLNGLTAYGIARFPGWVLWPPFLAPADQEMLSMVAQVFSSVSIWWLTGRDTFVTHVNQSFTVRSMIRALVLINLASAIGFHIAGDLVPLVARCYWLFADGIFNILQLLLFYGLMSQLARRLPDIRMANSFWIIKWILPLGVLWTRAAGVLPTLFNLFSFQARVQLPMPGYVLATVIELWLVTLLAQFTRRLLRVRLNQTVESLPRP